MAKREDDNKTNFINGSKKIFLIQKISSSSENKDLKIYLNQIKHINDDRINNKKVKNPNKIKGQKYKIIIKLILLINLFIRTFPTHKIHFINFYFSNITLRVKGPGLKKIFCSNIQLFSTDYYPQSIYIGNNKNDSVNFEYDFISTENVVKLVWNNKINNCIYMFTDCTDILQVDLSEFDSSEVTQINNMFRGCTSLISVNFDNFDTSQVSYMGAFFYQCSSLTSVNLSNFNISKVKTLRFSFYGCTSLNSLDLSSFYTSEVTHINSMFEGCINLEYINMKNFNEGKVLNGFNDSIFKNVKDNIVVCINETINQNIIIPQLKSIKCYNIDCSDNWKSKQKKIISSVNGCECELNGCLSCDNLNLGENKRICKVCNDNFYPIENTSVIYVLYYECYKEPKGYYLDTDDLVYKKCFGTCETCKIKGDNDTHNCLTCNDSFPFGIKFNNYINCYKNCSYNYYFDNEHIYYCTSNSSCPNEYSKLLLDKKKCVKDIKDVVENLKNNENEDNEEEEIKYYNNILEIVEDIFTSNVFDTSDLDNGVDEVVGTNFNDSTESKK